MPLLKDYVPPTTEDLEALKAELGYTGNQMAELAGVSGNNQWRKYTGGVSPRAMSPQMLFYIAAQLVLTEEELDRVVDKMKQLGATIQ